MDAVPGADEQIIDGDDVYAVEVGGLDKNENVGPKAGTGWVSEVEAPRDLSKKELAGDSVLKAGKVKADWVWWRNGLEGVEVKGYSDEWHVGDTDLAREGDGAKVGELKGPERDGEELSPNGGAVTVVQEGLDEVVQIELPEDDVLKGGQLNAGLDTSELGKLKDGVLGANRFDGIEEDIGFRYELSELDIWLLKGFDCTEAGPTSNSPAD